jgi:hypothetical protein
MVERQLPKLDTRVRFPSPALSFLHSAFGVGRSVFGVFFDESRSKHRTLNVEHPISNSEASKIGPPFAGLHAIY